MLQIGFMQGRLCDQVEGKIQAFPRYDWETEFPIAAGLGIRAMEWTIDHDLLYENPLMTTEGKSRIRALSRKHELTIPSLTGDCFMQAPFWKAKAAEKDGLKADFRAICRSCSAVGIGMVVIPLVDHGRLDNPEQEDELVEFLEDHSTFLAEQHIQVIFESDFAPVETGRFIDRLPADRFGINYDIGNSAALGFDPVEEFAAYGHRVRNVHVKDREFGGNTVPLTTGAARFDVVFGELAKVEYRGNFILQTARAADGSHASTLRGYYEMTDDWISQTNLVP